MVSYTANYNLALYDPVTDTSELFLAYRSDIAGTSDSNMTKLETELTTIQAEIDSITGGTIFVDAAFSSGSLYVATGISEITAYDVGLQILLRFDQDSDGTTTLNINTLGVKSIYKINDSGTGVNLVGAHIKHNKEYILRYNGTVWVIVSDIENPAVLTKNIEALSTDKTLTDYSEIVQDLDPNGADRDINLPAEDSKNPYFVIYNSGSGSYTLTIKNDSPATIGTIENDEVKVFYSTGVEWVGVSDIGFISPLTTKGDLFGYDTDDARIPVGADGKWITADSGEDLGVKWDDLPAASESVAGISEISTTAEINAGISETLVPNVDNLVESNIATKGWGYAPYDSDESAIVEDGKSGFVVPSFMDGWNIIDFVVAVHTKGITGTTDVQLRRRRAGSDVDVMSVKVTLGDEFYASDGTINTSNDDLEEGDFIYMDIDVIHSGTAPLGLGGTVTARTP